MTRFFNKAGPCRPEEHFMLPPGRRLPAVRRLVERKSYFVIHAPRQSGKTTALYGLSAELTAEGRHAAAVVTLEEGAPFGDDPGRAEDAVLGCFRRDIAAQLPPELLPPPWPAAAPGDRIAAALSAWAAACPRPIALFMDEIGQTFEPAAIDRAFDLSRGQPWLVNALAAQVVDEIVEDRAVPVTAAHVDQAKERIILSRATHLGSLAEKLREPRVQRVIEPVLAGREVGVEVPRDDIDDVEDLGLTARDAAGNLAIANPIYREVIPRELSSVTADVMVLPARSYRMPDGRLDADGLFDAFVAFWRRHAEPMVRGQSYPEIAPHIVLMAYLERVVNGGAMIEREYAAGSGRMDLCIRWPFGGGEQFVAIELKVWREKHADPLGEGLAQMEGYLGRLGLLEGSEGARGVGPLAAPPWKGFLVIFDRRRAAEEVPWDERPRWETHDLAGGKRVRVLRL